MFASLPTTDLTTPTCVAWAEGWISTPSNERGVVASSTLDFSSVSLEVKTSSLVLDPTNLT